MRRQTARNGLVWLVCLLCSACSKSPYDVVWYNEREYSLTLLDTEQQYPVMNVEVIYQGKVPPDDVSVSINWRRQDTDFYRVKFDNVSRHIVTLESIRYDLERGKLHSARHKDADGIINDYGTNTLYPGDSIDDRDAFVWAKGDNTLHRHFTFRIDGELVSLDIPLVYRR